MIPHVLRISAVALFALLVGACQDPSGVGLELIGEEVTDPNAQLVIADTTQIVEEEEFTGGFASGSSPAQSRVMVGSAVDPLLGDVVADAYFDFVTPATVPEGFFDNNVIAVRLHLVRSYAYGDSTGMLPMTLYEVNEDWSPVGAPVDTSFAADNELGMFTVMSADTVYSLELPASWVSENAEVLQSDTLSNALSGFKLTVQEGASPSFVAGFDTAESSVRVYTSQDSVDYPLSEVFTRLIREEAGMLPPANILYLRDGTGEALDLSFEFDGQANQALANATLRLSTDASALDEPGFVRGIISQLSLYGVTPDDDLVFIESAQFDPNNGAIVFSSSTLTSSIQAELVGDSIFDSYRIIPELSNSSINALPLLIGPEPSEGESDVRPRVILTLVPQPS